MTTPEPSSLSAEDAALVAEALAEASAWWPTSLGSDECRHLAQALAPVLAQIRADERRRAGEREAALRERVEREFGALADEIDEIDGEAWCELGGVSIGGAVRHQIAALTADEPEAAEGGAEGETRYWADRKFGPTPSPTPPGHDESPEAGAREDQ